MTPIVRKRVLGGLGVVFAVGVALIATVADAHVWRAYCGGRRTGYVVDTSAECNAATQSWSTVGVICRDMKGQVRQDALDRHFRMPTGSSVDLATCKGAQDMIGCYCQPEAVPGD
jgi:hypothetical protein